MPSALVTGASSGIGRALSERLAARGYTVGLAARRRALLDEVAHGITRNGGRALVIELDVSDAEATVAAVERAWDELGGLDLVIANAGFGSDAHATKLDWSKVAPILRVDALGAIATLTAALPRMVARGSGHLVGISSLAGIRGLPTSAAYSAAKAALSTFLESLRVDLGGTGIAVTDVRPGFIATDATRDATYPMPMLMQLDEAVDRILAGIDRREGVVAFPLPMATLLAGSRLLPLAAYDALVRRLSRTS
jgi:short-subunit dehydrogenase